MIFDRLSNRTEILPGWREIACEMSAHQRIDRKEQSIDDKNPGEEQMPLPSHREPSRAGDCRPTGKGADRPVRIAKHAGGVERMSQNRRDPADVAILYSDWTNGKKRTIAIGTISPIERRMGIEDLQPAHDEDE